MPVAPSPPSPLALPLDVGRGMVGAYADRASIVATFEQVLTATRLDPDDLEAVITDSLMGAPAAKAAWPLAASKEDITAAVGAITVPTLVISGTEERTSPAARIALGLPPAMPQTAFGSSFRSRSLLGSSVARFLSDAQLERGDVEHRLPSSLIASADYRGVLGDSEWRDVELTRRSCRGAGWQLRKEGDVLHLAQHDGIK